MKTAEEGGQLVVNGTCPTQYLLDVIVAKAKEIYAENKDLALKLMGAYYSVNSHDNEIDHTVNDEIPEKKLEEVSEQETKLLSPENKQLYIENFIKTMDTNLEEMKEFIKLEANLKQESMNLKKMK